MNGTLFLIRCGRAGPDVATVSGAFSRHWLATMQDTDKTARYVQIVNLLQARIASGIYPVGSLLPTEAELCAEFDVSRYTVREALRRLTAMGLVSRRQGSGTIVERTEARQGYFFALRSLSELFQYALDTHYRVIGINEATLTTVQAEEIGGKRGSPWTVVTGLRSSSKNAPAFCLTRSFIPHRLAWLAPELPGCIGPFYAHLEKRANEPIITAEQHISAAKMPREVAAALDVPAGEVSLLMLRRYMSAKGTVIASYNWHIASEFTYRMALQRDT
jgi:GntR family transcriptional regulator